MGKGNRTRNERAIDALATVTPRQASKKKGMPTWVGTLIVLAVLALLVLFVTFIVLNSRGTFTRMRTAAESEHYEVSVPMMQYMVKTQYYNHVGMYEQFGANIQIGGGEGGDVLDKNKPLREQIYSSKTDENGQVTTLTWFDYYAGNAEKEVLNILACCEEARANGMKLDKNDKQAIKAQLAEYEEYAAANGFSADGYISAMYGKGVLLKDLRKMMKLAQLASKWSQYKEDEIIDAISADEQRLQEYYAANKHEIDVYCDYTAYTFTAVFTPSQNADDNAANAEKYAAEQAKYAGYIEKLNGAKDAADFNGILLNILLEEERAKGASEEECSAAAEAKLEAAKFVDQSDPNSAEAMYEWLFETKTVDGAKIYQRKAGDLKKFEETEKAFEEPAEGEEREYEEATSTYSVCFVNSDMHRREGLVRSVGHILFSNETYDGLTSTEKLTGADKAIADKILARDGVVTAYAMAVELLNMMKDEREITREKREDGSEYYVIDKSVFERYGNAYTGDGNVFYDNVPRGQMVKEFENWLFDGARVEGEITYADPVKTAYGYHIMYYVGNEIDGWKGDIVAKLTPEDHEAHLEGIKATHPVTFRKDNYRFMQD